MHLLNALRAADCSRRRSVECTAADDDDDVQLLNILRYRVRVDVHTTGTCIIVIISQMPETMNIFTDVILIIIVPVRSRNAVF